MCSARASVRFGYDRLGVREISFSTNGFPDDLTLINLEYQLIEQPLRYTSENILCIKWYVFSTFSYVQILTNHTIS